jgi:hypothetical protein
MARSKKSKKRPNCQEDAVAGNEGVHDGSGSKKQKLEDEAGPTRIQSWRDFLDKVVLKNDMLVDEDLDPSSEVAQCLKRLKSLREEGMSKKAFKKHLAELLVSDLQKELSSVLISVLKDKDNTLPVKAAALIFCCLCLDMKCLPEEALQSECLVRRKQIMDHNT